MLSKGVGALSNAELIAIMIRSGSGGKNALELSQEVLRHSGGSLEGLRSMSCRSLCRIGGIGEGKALSILASLELGRRAFSERNAEGCRNLSTPEAVYSLMLPAMKGLDHEECWVLFLGRGNKLIDKELMSRGGDASTTFDIKRIVRKVLDSGASSVIMVHNHPSGDPMPGKADILCTELLRKALVTFDVTLTDHVIVCDSGYFSFCDNCARFPQP